MPVTKKRKNGSEAEQFLKETRQLESELRLAAIEDKRCKEEAVNSQMKELQDKIVPDKKPAATAECYKDAASTTDVNLLTKIYSKHFKASGKIRLFIFVIYVFFLKLLL